MDYRFRKYYLVKMPFDSYDMRLRFFKIAAPSLKIHSPYNHFKENKKDYDGVYTRLIGLSSMWNLLISCNKEDSESLEYELKKSKRNDTGSNFLEVHKNLLGQ